MNRFDIIIIGSGPGGYETAVKAARAGLATAIVEQSHLGGTCLNQGCIPTKCLCHDAELIYALSESSDFDCANAQSLGFSLTRAMQRKAGVIDTLRGGIAQLMQTPGITLLAGSASFTDAHTIAVAGADGTTQTITAPHIVIATGSKPKFLPIEGAHTEGVLTSTELLSIDSVPASLCIIGGGVIGLEFASIFNAFGCKVTVVEYCKEILPAFDADVAKRLRLALKKQGIAFQTGAAVTRIELNGNYLVSYEQKGKTAQVEAERVLMAVGRQANLEAMNFAHIGLATTPRGITVNENMLTNVEGVYAVGDVNGLCQLAHAASAQGERALNHILGRADNLRLDIMPAAVFTTPEAATVGLTEEQCKAQGREYIVQKAAYRSNGKALSMESPEGMAKILATPDGHILGCHIYGAHAADLISEVAVAMNANLTLDRLTQVIHTHPTLSEVVLRAARG